MRRLFETTNGLGITDKHPSESKMKQVIDSLNKPLRKVAHASEYFVFTILILIALKNSELTGKKLYLIALLICFIYACSDEFHQLFVSGRTAQFTDSLIDALGGIIGCLLYKITYKLKIKRRKMS